MIVVRGILALGRISRVEQDVTFVRRMSDDAPREAQGRSQLWYYELSIQLHPLAGLEFSSWIDVMLCLANMRRRGRLLIFLGARQFEIEKMRNR